MLLSWSYHPKFSFNMDIWSTLTLPNLKMSKVSSLKSTEVSEILKKNPI